MSRRTDHRAGRGRDEGGFTLIEVIVALTLVALVAVAAFPLLVATVRAANSAKLNTQAKNLAQQRIEQMRNMPFRVEAQNASPVVDLLDRYYRDRSVAVTAGEGCVQRSYVPVGGAVVASDPAPPFYRCVAEQNVDGVTFTQSIATQLLGTPSATAAGAEVPPPVPVDVPVGYDTQIANMDAIVSQLVGVTIVTTWGEVGGKTRSYRSYTQIANSSTPRQSINAGGRAVAVRVNSVTPLSAGSGRLTFEAGIVDLKGTTYTGSTAGLSATGAFAELDGTPRAVGQSASAAAPPTVDLADKTVDLPGGVLGTCTYVCFGSSFVSGLKASTDSGLPTVATSASRLTAALKTGSVGGLSVNGFQYTNVPDLLTAARLRLAGPVVSSTEVGSKGHYATADGYLETSAITSTVTLKTSMQTGTIGIFATDFAPGGVLRAAVTADVSCITSTASAAAVSTPTGPAPMVTLEYLPAGANPSSGYVPLSPTAVLSSLPVGASPTSTLRLSDYIPSQPVRGAAATSTQASGRYGESTVSAALRIVTAGTRSLPNGTSDPDSAVTVELGLLACSSEDQR